MNLFFLTEKNDHEVDIDHEVDLMKDTETDQETDIAAAEAGHALAVGINIEERRIALITREKIMTAKLETLTR